MCGELVGARMRKKENVVLCDDRDAYIYQFCNVFCTFRDIVVVLSAYVKIRWIKLNILNENFTHASRDETNLLCMDLEYLQHFHLETLC